MIKKVAIIGAGQLGSRHLQGVAQSAINISIEVVEPFESSREVAKSRYYEIENREQIESIVFLSSIEELSSDLDLVIIATGADVRAKVVTELLSSKNVENLLLEKVLFQTIEDYYTVEKLLEESGTNCWVNHARRMFPIYEEIKDRLKGASQISYNFQGGDWGLACNALHFIDHLCFLSDGKNLIVDNQLLDSEIYNSKREGFIEFNGLLTGKIDNHTFSLSCNKEATPFIFTIVSDTLVITIDEGSDKIEILSKENSWERERLEERIIYYQSELSNRVVEDILVNKSTLLPTYNEAMRLHIPFIEALLEKMNQINGLDNKICPIT